MGAHSQSETSPRDHSSVRLRQLLKGGEEVSVAQVIESLGLWEREPTARARPRLLLNMVSSADGRATLSGRSGPLSDAADRALFHGLRSAVDAVLVGAHTVRAERYGRIIPDPARRLMRTRRGLAAEPLACVVSNSLDLGDAPLLQEPEARIVLLTASTRSVARTHAQVDYIREHQDGALELEGAMDELHSRFAVQSVLCEGGPHLASQLLGAGLVDELFLALSPTLAGGDPAGEKALRILAGEELSPPLKLELLDVLGAGSSLFLRYGVPERVRVSRATMLSSSLAS
jgi:riboflavin biosynthesis pyrimidine reductase